MNDSSTWNCDLHFNETEDPNEDLQFIDFSAVMLSKEPYHFPPQYNGLNNKKKLIFALQVMYIKAGFY